MPGCQGPLAWGRGLEAGSWRRLAGRSRGLRARAGSLVKFVDSGWGLCKLGLLGLKGQAGARGQAGSWEMLASGRSWAQGRLPGLGPQGQRPGASEAPEAGEALGGREGGGGLWNVGPRRFYAGSYSDIGAPK